MYKDDAAQRDLDGGFTASRLVESGQYPAEISRYGYLWQDASGRRCTLEADGSAVLESHRHLREQGIPCSDVFIYQTQHTLTPAERCTFWKTLQQNLCAQLAAVYNEAYFSIVSQLLSVPNTNFAAPILEACVNHWRHDRQLSALLGPLINQAYQSKLLYPATQQALLDSLPPRNLQTPVDCVTQRQLSGFAWLGLDQQWHFFADWWPAKVLLRQTDLTKAGLLVTPLDSQYYTLTENDGTLLPKLRQAFLNKLRSQMTAPYLTAILQLKALPSAINPALWENLLSASPLSLHPAALAALNGYACRLHLWSAV